MSNLRLMGAVASALLVVPVAVRGADAPAAAAPDEEFLEYLGSWEGNDSDWIVLQGVSDQTGGKVPQERVK